MPAIITHHLFGEDAANRLPAGIIEGQEDLLAFLLGNQGPDPFLARFSTTPQAAEACHELAQRMHRGKVCEALLAVRDAVSHLPEDDKRVGRAFALGLLGHYALDSHAHPFVHAQETALIEVDPSLEPYRREVHALIESDLDSWMLWSQRALTVADAPTHANLARTARISRVAGALFSQVAWQVFGLEVGADAYGASVADYELVYRVIDPAPSVKSALLAHVEGRLRGGRSYLQALAHRVQEGDECPAANLACHPWTDPETGETHVESFPDLYVEALDAWPAMAEALTRGDADGLAALTAGLDYHGRQA